MANEKALIYPIYPHQQVQCAKYVLEYVFLFAGSHNNTHESVRQVVYFTISPSYYTFTVT